MKTKKMKISILLVMILVVCLNLFPKTVFAADTSITSVALTFDESFAPKAGGSCYRDYQNDISGVENFTFRSTPMWCSGPFDSLATFSYASSTTDKFSANIAYTLRLSFTANSGYTFAGIDVNNITVNGNAPLKIQDYGTFLNIFILFPATENDGSPIISEDLFEIPPSCVGDEVSINVSEYVSGGTLPYTYSISNSCPWLSINSTTGVITGTPSSEYYLTSVILTVTDYAGLSSSKKIIVGAVRDPFIRSLSLGGIDAPIAGQTTERSLSSVTGAVLAEQHCYVSNYYWYAGNAVYPNVFAGTGYPATAFANDQIYELNLVVYPASGYMFDGENNSWSLDGATFVSSTIMLDGSLLLRFSFPATGSLNKIDRIDLTAEGFAEPVVGESMARDINTITGFNSSECEIVSNNTYWSSDDGNGPNVGFITTLTFDAETQYSLLIRLMAKNGYVFDPHAAFTFNGMNASDIYLFAGDTIANLRFDFPTTGSLTEIGRIDLTAEGFAVPVFGESMARDINTITGFNSSECEIDSNNTFWVTNAGSGSRYNLSSSGTFAGSTQYSLHIRLKAKPGYTFDPNATYTFNGMTVSYKDIKTGNTIAVLRFDYDATLDVPKITNLELGGIFAPVAGATMPTDINLITGLENCSVRKFSWYYTGNIVIDSDTQTEKTFAQGTIYRICIGIIPDDGYAIDRTGTFTLNGISPDAMYNRGTYFDFYYTFPKTAGEAVKITSINLGGIDAPVAGESVYRPIKTCMTGLGEQCKLSTYSWYLNGSYFAGPSNTVLTFDYSTVYQFVMTINAEPGYEFDFDTVLSNCTLDGATLASAERHSDNQSVYLKFDFPATDMPPTISGLSLTMDNPVNGKTPPTKETINISGLEHCSVSSLGWWTADGNTEVTGQFAPGTQYRLILTLNPDDGYVFDYTGTYTINGQPTSAESWPTSSLRITYIFPATSGGATQITSLNLGGIDAPVGGGTVNRTLSDVTGLENFTINTMNTWWKRKSNGSEFQRTFRGISENFMYSTEYQLELALLANPGYEFDLDALNASTCTLEGATFVSTRKDGYYVYITFNFPATAGKIKINELNLSGISAPSSEQSVFRDINNITGLSNCHVSMNSLDSYWTIDDSNKLYLNNTTSKFASGTVYKLYIQIIANSGYAVHYYGNYTLNGMSPTSKDIGADDSLVILCYTFPKIAYKDPVFNDTSIDVPEIFVNDSITLIDASVAVSGGIKPYTYFLVDNPAWLSIDSATGVITGTPTVAAAATTAKVKVVDSGNGNEIVKTINIGAVKDYISISEITLGNIPSPVLLRSVTIALNSITGQTNFEVVSGEWLHLDNTTFATFISNIGMKRDIYKVKVCLKPNKHYTFDYSDISKFKLGTLTAQSIVPYDGNGIEIIFNPFPTITNVNLVVPEPVLGDAISDEKYTNVTIPDDAPYTASEIVWKDNNDNVCTGNFVVGVRYFAHFRLMPKDNAVYFTNSTTYTVDGMPLGEGVSCTRDLYEFYIKMKRWYNLSSRTVIENIVCDTQNPLTLTLGQVIPANDIVVTVPSESGLITAGSFLWRRYDTLQREWVDFETIEVGKVGTIPVVAGRYMVIITLNVGDGKVLTHQLPNSAHRLSLTIGEKTYDFPTGLAEGPIVYSGPTDFSSYIMLYSDEINVACGTHTHGSFEHDYIKHWEICSICGMKFGEEVHSFAPKLCECGLNINEIPAATIAGLDFGIVKVGYGDQIGQDIAINVTSEVALTYPIVTIDSTAFKLSRSYGNNPTFIGTGLCTLWYLVPNTGLSAGTHSVTITLTASNLLTPVTATATIVVEPITFTFQLSESDETGKKVITITSPEEYTLPENIFTAPAAKTFECWRLKDVGRITSGKITPAGNDLVFYPIWNTFLVTATFNENGGSRTGSSNVITNNSTEVIHLATPNVYGISAPANKAFRGWALGSPSGKHYNAGDNYNVTCNESITFYAIWDDYSYNVSFDAGEGTGTMTGLSGKSFYEIPACTFIAPKEMTFDYWTVSGDETKYRQGDVWTATSDNQSVTFRAVYKKLNYTVKFDGNGSTGNGMSDVNGSGSYILPGCNFTTPADKKNFSHWALGSPSGERYNISDPYYPTTDGETVTFYAVWINKDEQAPIIVTSKNTLTFGESLVLTATGGSSSMPIRFEVTNGTGQATWNGSVLTVQKVGTITVKAIKDTDANYLAAESEIVTITIVPKVVNAPDEYTGEFIYTGAELTYNIGVSGEYRAKDNSNKRTDANESGYTVTVELVDKINTVWADTNDNVDKTFIFIIKKATPAITVNFSPITADGITLENANLSLEVPPTAGELSWVLPVTTIAEENKAYEWIFTPEDTGNYNVVKGTIVVYSHEVHKYDNDCDADCNICGEVRTITHSYSLKHNETEHWDECTLCGLEKENSRTAHLGGTATCFEKAKCSVCGVEYGEIDANNHVKDTFIYTINADQKTHTKLNECCDAVVNASEAHEFSEWTVTKEATVTEKGEKKRICVCGYEETAIIPASDGKITVDGFVFEVGDKLPESAAIIVKKIDTATDEGKAVLNALIDKDYNSSKAVLIFDIHSFKDGVKVQPNGTIKVTLDKPIADVDNYVIYHIKDDGSIETLYADVENNKISFNISSFSNFVFAEKLDLIDTPNEGLTTGAIVAIVIASVIVVALGGFAIFWFIIKKKKFADIITIFKK